MSCDLPVQISTFQFLHLKKRANSGSKYVESIERCKVPVSSTKSQRNTDTSDVMAVCPTDKRNQ